MKISDEYFGGCSTWYMTSRTMLEEGLKQLDMLKEDAGKMAAANLHELLRCNENYHRILSVEAHATTHPLQGGVQVSGILLQR